MPIRPDHKMSVAEAKLEVEAEGYRLARVDRRLPRQHVLIFEPTSAPASVRTETLLGRPFELQVGERAGDATLAITFLGVDGDSRCPRSVVCAWAGNATARFSIAARGSSSTITLHTSGLGSMPSVITVFDRTIRLRGLAPYPEREAIPSTSYVATLVVE